MFNNMPILTHKKVLPNKFFIKKTLQREAEY